MIPIEITKIIVSLKKLKLANSLVTIILPPSIRIQHIPLITQE